MTISVWVKRGSSGAINTIMGGYDGTSAVSASFSFSAADQLNFNAGGATSIPLTSTQVFRDFSAWYHIVLSIDNTQATAANRTKMYVNGVQITSFSATNYPALNQTNQLNAGSGNTNNKIGAIYNGTSYFDGYMAEFYLIDGQALTPSSFGQYDATTGVWGPIAYTGTYGNNGFYLNFKDNSAATAAAIGKDSSGNGNNWTPNNISVTSGVTYDSMLDYPASSSDSSGNNIGNYAVLNPLVITSTARGAISDGGLTASLANASTSSVFASYGMSSGKWYWEFTWTYNAQGLQVGIDTNPFTIASTAATLAAGGLSTGYGYYNATGNKVNNNTRTAYGTAWYTSGQTYVIGVAFDADAGTLSFYLNGTSQGSAFTGLTSGPYYPSAANTSSASGPAVVYFNFGQRPFSYSPPSGYSALNAYNLATPTVLNGALYMAASTYTGTGATQTISNGGNNTLGTTFKPDVVWIKSRSAATNNIFFDSIRGTTNYFITNASDANTTNANSLTAFGASGFTLGSDATPIGVNVNTATYIGWQWQAGQGSTSSNTSGSITSTVSVNATAGFSVVSYTGTGAAATIGHSLGVAPSMIAVKRRSAIDSWQVYSVGLPSATYCMQLNSTAAQTAANSVWNGTAPTSTVFSVGTDTSTNASTSTYMAYCWSAVAGYSAFGKYTGNGSTDGPFVYLGFRPRWIIIKRADAVSDWSIWDTSRDTYNVETATLLSNSAAAQTSATSIDVLSNGFKCRSATVVNVSTGTYVYAAFAENPFKYSNAR